MSELNPSIREEVRQIIRQFLEFTPGQRLPNFMEYVDSSTGLRKRVDIHVYIYGMFQTISSLVPTLEKEDKPMSMVGLVYAMLGSQSGDPATPAKMGNSCNLTLHVSGALSENPLTPVRGTVVRGVPGTTEYVRYRDYTSQLDNLALMFNYNVTNCKDRLVAVPLSLNVENEKDGHQNVLIVFKMTEDLYFVVVYEPHGWEDDFSSSELRSSFLENLQLAVADVSKKYVWLPMENTSCPVGMQNASTDSVGYCVMFSNFWLYCVLRCFPDLSKLRKPSEFQHAIYSIERVILDEVAHSSLLMMITNFTIAYCEQFWSMVRLRPEQMKKFDAEMLHHLESEGRTRFVTAPLTMNTLFPKSLQEKKELMDVDHEDDGGRVADGAPCERDEDCLSHCCKGGTCVTVNYNQDMSDDETKVDVDDDFAELIRPIFRNAANFALTTDVRRQGQRTLSLLENCLRTADDETAVIWGLITFFFSREAVHMICNGTIAFNRFDRTFATGHGQFVSIDSSEDVERLAQQVMYRTNFSGRSSFLVVTAHRWKWPQMPYHLILLYRSVAGIELCGVSVNDSDAYLKPLGQFCENLARAMASRSSSNGKQVTWRGFEALHLEPPGPLYSQTMEHLVNGLLMVFFVQFGHRYSSLNEALQKFTRVTGEFWTLYKSELERVVCKFAIDLLHNRPGMDPACLKREEEDDD